MSARLSSAQPYSDEAGNTITCGADVVQQNVSIEFRSNNCSIVLGAGVTLTNVNFLLCADNSSIVIGNESHVRGADFMLGVGSSVRIGSRLSMTGGGYYSAAENTAIDIGDDCMFATRIDIRSDHAHPIFDRATGRRSNPSRSVRIGDHVWLGPDVIVMPGASIGAGSIVGSRSIVTRPIAGNVVAVGSPARAIKHNVKWERSHLAQSAPFLFPSVPAENPWPPQPALAGFRSALRRLLGLASAS